MADTMAAVLAFREGKDNINGLGNTSNAVLERASLVCGGKDAVYIRPIRHTIHIITIIIIIIIIAITITITIIIIVKSLYDSCLSVCLGFFYRPAHSYHLTPTTTASIHLTHSAPPLPILTHTTRP
ncbi:hypothetical protein E2C01_033643 [Portunus trituberculatus]|uniref:Uncharacterized protein n=1 Tax=Portunus trituberculatus TaxID=210409 RepID=A0A5B7EYG1_PORTR|nr:hypothetical protein [Portunus trituberculatus]